MSGLLSSSRSRGFWNGTMRQTELKMWRIRTLKKLPKCTVMCMNDAE
jgi:hypothetical protein